MDLDVSLRKGRPDAPKLHTEESECWERSNRMSMMIMRIRIPPKYRGIVPEDVTTAEEYLSAVEKCYEKYEMGDINMVASEFYSRNKKPDENVREYIMMKMTATANLKKLGMHIPDNVAAKIVLESLPSEYDRLKRTFSLLKEKWSTHELISHCVQEDDIFKWFKKEHDLVEGKVVCGKKRTNYED